MRRADCRGCGAAAPEMFLDLGMMPSAGGFLENAAAIPGEALYPLPVHVCPRCSLVQILEVIDPGELFRNYAFSSSTVGPLVTHFQQYAAWIQERFKPGLVVEFGANDGILLAPLAALGVRACGVDISENITRLAREKGLDVVTGFFDRKTAEGIRARLGAADLVTGSNAFAHNDRPEAILDAARSVLRLGGILCLEVMYAGDLLEQLQWDTLYHEHLTFYSLGTISSLLSRHGFRVVHAERIPMHGGSLRLAASLDAAAEPAASVAELLRWEEARKLNDPETWRAFGRRIGRSIAVVKDTLGRLAKTSRIWGYGAAGKATLWLNACNLTFLEAIVDASPLRAGKLMPGTHTPIVFPEELKKRPPDYIFVTAWNYAELIRSKETWFEGIWVTPLPEMRFF